MPNASWPQTMSRNTCS